jgi:apolipoprotein N-acyltransferase
VSAASGPGPLAPHRSGREFALAMVSGLLLGAAFFPGPFGFLAWFGFVPLLMAIDSRLAAMAAAPPLDPGRARRGGAGRILLAPFRAIGRVLGSPLFRLGYVFGLVFYLIGAHWIALLSEVAITVPWLKYPAWLAAGAYLALYAGLSTWLMGTLSRRTGVGLAGTFPFAYLLVEELRASGELGFPWFQPGYSQHAYAPVIQLASLGSVSLVTLWLLGVNALIWRALAGPARRRAAVGALLVLILPWVWGQRVLDAAPRGHGPAIAMVQANVSGEIKWSGKHQRQILDTFLALSDTAMATGARPRLVIWPETATGSYLRKQVEQVVAVYQWVGRTGVPIFSGFADYDYGPADALHYYNAAGLLGDPAVADLVYAKRHLVPFGERMPFQKFLPGLGKLELGQAEWTPGSKPELFPSPWGPFTCLVCFEGIFPDLTREDVRRGARWIVNITNDEWFGNSSAPYQHAAMAGFRAGENHVPLARCANTGLTLLADSYGRVERKVPVFTPAVLVAPMPEPSWPTLYTRLGDWPGLLAAIVVALLVVVGIVRARRGEVR